MNKSNFAHAGLALAFQFVIAGLLLVLGLDFGYGMIVGHAFASGFYFGREVAQHERKAGTPPWWSGFRIHEWSKDAVMDFVTPYGATAVAAVAFA